MSDAPDSDPLSDALEPSAPPSSEPPDSSDRPLDSTSAPGADTDPEELCEDDLHSEEGRSSPKSAAPPGPPPKKGTTPSPGPSRDLPPPKSERIAVACSKAAANLPPRQFPPKTVTDIMTRKVFVVSEDDSLENIEESMERFRFRHLPVVDESHKILGVVSHRDILRASASTLSEMTEARNEFIQKHAKVAVVMNRKVVTVGPDETVHDAGKLMRRKGIGCVLVENEEEILLGIVTEADYMDLAIALVEAAQS